MKIQGITTQALHTPFEKKDPHGSIRMPVYDTAAFEFDTAENLADGFQGKIKAHQYSRGSNPTIEYLETVIREMYKAQAVVATSSGMSAIANLTFALASAGDNIIASKYLFGNTYSFFANTIRDLGIETRWFDPANPNTLVDLVDGKTRLIFTESISNPQLIVPDFTELKKSLGSKKIPIVLDSTLTPINIFNSKNFGIDVEIASLTKYMSGGGTTIGGVIIDQGLFDWSLNPKTASWTEKAGKNALFAKIKKEIFRNTGGCLSPHNAFMHTLALETLELRVDRISKNAILVAEWLENHSNVSTVHYTGLSSSPYFEIAQKQFCKERFGGLMTLDLESEKYCMTFMNKLKLIRRATNLNENRSLIIHPWSTIYAEYSSESKMSQGIRDTQMRLSIGIENPEDLLSDLSNALN